MGYYSSVNLQFRSRVERQKVAERKLGRKTRLRGKKTPPAGWFSLFPAGWLAGRPESTRPGEGINKYEKQLVNLDLRRRWRRQLLYATHTHSQLTAKLGGNGWKLGLRESDSGCGDTRRRRRLGQLCKVARGAESSERRSRSSNPPPASPRALSAFIHLFRRWSFLCLRARKKKRERAWQKMRGGAQWAADYSWWSETTGYKGCHVIQLLSSRATIINIKENALASPAADASAAAATARMGFSQ
jgi:hypothetical protein